jgi:hypothetical protein
VDEIGDASFLSKVRGGRKRTAGGTKRSPTEELSGEGGPDEAVAFIAETVVELVKLADSHQLEVLRYLLGMVLIEADERMRTRSKRKLS